MYYSSYQDKIEIERHMGKQMTAALSQAGMGPRNFWQLKAEDVNADDMALHAQLLAESAVASKVSIAAVVAAVCPMLCCLPSARCVCRLPHTA